MANKFLDSIKNIFVGKKMPQEQLKEGMKNISVAAMEHRYEMDDLVGAAAILRNLLELYGEGKRKNHRTKGREFIHFILSSKHKDLKSQGYEHWQNINKIIHLNKTTVYPYHKQNLRKAMDFYKKEIKAINSIDVTLPE